MRGILINNYLKNINIIIIISAIFFLKMHCIAKPNIHYIGYAYDINSNELLYTEDYNEYTLNGQHGATAVYRDIDNQIIAKKEINYSTNKSAPDLNFINEQTGVIASVNINEQVNISYRASFSRRLKKNSFPVINNLVVDSGFHYFIKQFWPELMLNKKLSVNYVSPSKLGIIPLVIKLHQEEVWERPNTVVFIVKPASFILQLFVPPIFLRYDINSQQLLSFQGISNIKFKSGKKHVRLEIDYNVADKVKI